MLNKKERKEYNIDRYLILFCLYLVIFVLVPYALAFLKPDLTAVHFVLLLYVNPILCTLLGAVETYRYTFQPLGTLVPMIAFLFAIILIYNSSALIYVPFYGILFLVGCGIGGYARMKESKEYKKPSIFAKFKKRGH